MAVCPCQVSAQSDTSSSDHLLLTIDMEPISLSVIFPVVTLFLTKALEKTGEIFGEKAVKQFSEYGVEALALRLQKIASADPEIAEAIISLANTVIAQPQSVQTLSNIANKIGIIAPGSVFNNSSFNF